MLPRDRRRSLANEWHHFILSNYADVVSNQAVGTVIHDEFMNYRHCSIPSTEFFVIDATTTEATLVALQDGEQTCVLNFASYCNPGGGFLNGAMAQEEALCASSTLYEVLIEQEDKFYNENRKATNKGLYTNRRLFSPKITFFDDNRKPVGEASVITCAAPNYRAASRNGIHSNVCNNEVWKRVSAVLNSAAHFECGTLILGAFGCGVFGNDPKIVSDAFLTLLQTDYKNVFEKVIFAIPGKNGINYATFESTFRPLIEKEVLL